MFEAVINILARGIEGVAALLIAGAVVAGAVELAACLWREGFRGHTAGARLRLASGWCIRSSSLSPPTSSKLS